MRVPKMGTSLWTLVVTVIGVATICDAQNLFVAAPNTLRMGANETVAIFSYQGVNQVKIYLTDYPGKKKQFCITNVTVNQEQPAQVNIMVRPEDIPDLHLKSNNEKHYVMLVTKAPGFDKEMKILVTPFSGYVFLQTDKPIYTPVQSVKIRILKLDEDMSPNNDNFTLQIRNPQNVVMENIQSKSKEITSKSGIYSYVFDFPKHPVTGIWSVVVFYGLKVPKNTSVTFEVEKYILPTFEVKVKAPDYILPDAKTVTVDVDATYVYGQKVDGFATFKFAFQPDGSDVIHFGNKDAVELQNGHAECTFNTSEMKNNSKVGWFPHVHGGRLVVEAVVRERATGDKETRTESSTIFATSPYLISFRKCLNDFKAGLVTSVEADISLVGGKPASDVPAAIKAQDDKGRNIFIKFPDSKSSASGRVAFVFKTFDDSKHIKITIKTEDPKVHQTSQFEGQHIMFAFASKTNNYVAIERTDQGETLKVNTIKTLTVHSHPNKSLPLFYLITSQGRVVEKGSITKQATTERSVRFHVKEEMVPSIRVTLFAHNGDELLTDSIKFDVLDVCSRRGQIDLSLDFGNHHAEPGKTGNIIVTGTPNTAVGILAVDQAVHVLRKKDLLTREKMFQEMESHDLGCGPGGGLNSQVVLENAGLMIETNQATANTERQAYTCTEKKRRKREIRTEIHAKHAKHGKQTQKCCELGTKKDKLQRSCEIRALIVLTFEGKGLENSKLCAETFFNCCQAATALHSQATISRDQKESHRMVGSGFGRNGMNEIDELEFVEDDELSDKEEAATERKDFRETWLFEIALIGADGRLKIAVSLPHSITTWVVQAVGVSPKFIGGGMCVAEPKTVVAFNSLFMQVKMPYNVVRNEQIEIPVTIFNYSPRKQSVVVYFYGLPDLCSQAQPGEKSSSKRILVGPHSSAYIGFPMVPLEATEFPIKFVATSASVTDVVTKTLNVIAEGVPHEEDIVFTIDPSNTQKRKRRNIVNEKYSVNYDDDGEIRMQTTIVKLVPEVEYVPGTESCYITAIGDKFGATIHTSLANPEKLIRLPQGCGEQNMAFMAPTLYTLEYLKVTGKLTAEQENNGYRFIREGYKREQSFRKSDGSYSAWTNRPSSTWLTAFVAKVFCQADKFIFVDQTIVCSALTWLSQNQQPNGSFVEKYAIIHREMMGGVSGHIPLTSFVLLAFEKCKCTENNMTSTKEKATNFLKFHIPKITDPYQLSLATYALAVASPGLAVAANKNLLALARYNEGLNQMHWGDGKTGKSIETTSYALKTQLIYRDMDTATSIVNWMNTQRTVGGAFWSTQDTVAAIEALSQYAIRSRDPDVNLVCNLTSTNDPTFNERIEFKPDNARVLKVLELKRLGGTIFVESEGSGVSTMGIKLRYNIPASQDQLCKFDLTVNVSVPKEIKKEEKKIAKDDDLLNLFPDALIVELQIEEEKKKASEAEKRLKDLNLGAFGRNIGGESRSLGGHSVPPPNPFRFKPNLGRIRLKRGISVNPNPADGKPAVNSKHILNVTICAKYLKNGKSNMAVIDAGMLTGYKADTKDLKALVNDSSLPIARFEETGRSVIFYLDEISSNKETCFWFKIAREFVMSNLESSVVRVYDYYEPEQACSEFYRPDQKEANIRTVCTGSVCKCAEGGCPAKEPFAEAMEKGNFKEQRKLLQEIACHRHDFFWKGQIESKNKEKSGFWTYEFRIQTVLKEGIEKKIDLEQEIREFTARGNCETTNLERGKTYLIMGRDQEAIQDENGNKRHIYYIDKTTRLHEWHKQHSSAIKKNLQKHFSYLERIFSSNKGCLD